MGVGPKDLLATVYAAALAPVDPVALRAWLGDRLDALRAVPAEDRLARRRDRWSAPLPGSPPSVPGPGPEIA
jgi:hypothetical protein